MDPLSLVQRGAGAAAAQGIGADEHSNRPAMPRYGDFLTVLNAR